MAPSRQGILRDTIIILLARCRRLRVIGHVHTGNFGEFYANASCITRWLVRAAWKQLDGLVILSERLRGLYAAIPELDEKIHVVFNPLPVVPATERFVRSQRRPPMFGHLVHLLFLSNLVRSKGYLDAIDATVLLRDDYGVRARLVLAGTFMLDPADPHDFATTGEARDALRSHIEATGLHTLVQYVGPIAGAEKMALLQRAHFLLLPTYYSLEGQPLAIAEALSWGVVPVVTAYRAIPDLVHHDITGVHVPPHDPKAIAHEIHRLVTAPDRYRALSRGGYRHCQRLFSADAHTDTMRRLLFASRQSSNTIGRCP
jgi:glycosyltransferase involved in cell wall biosynthesis